MANKTSSQTTHSNEEGKTRHFKNTASLLTQVDNTDMNKSSLRSKINRLMDIFIVEIRKEFACSGLKYEAEQYGLNYVSGVMGEYRCSFFLQIGNESYGEVCLASQQSFMSSDISNIENRLAGLLMNLHQLLRHHTTNSLNTDNNLSADSPEAFHA